MSIGITTAPNLRDVGGWPTRGGGHVRTGLVYRSAGLGGLHGADLVAFAELDIRTVYDLRTADEIAAHPDTLPPDIGAVALDVLADSTQEAPAELYRLLEEPALAESVLGNGKAEGMFATAYRDIVGLPSALAAYRQLFDGLADPARRPALYHCTTGKDRTGWATAALLLLLGVPEDVVREEYLLTNTALLPTLKPILDRFEQRGGDPQLLMPVLGVRPGYLEVAMDEMHTRFGSIEGYFTDGLGVSGDTQATLRDALVEG